MLLCSKQKLEGDFNRTSLVIYRFDFFLNSMRFEDMLVILEKDGLWSKIELSTDLATVNLRNERWVMKPLCLLRFEETEKRFRLTV